MIDLLDYNFNNLNTLLTEYCFYAFIFFRWSSFILTYSLNFFSNISNISNISIQLGLLNSLAVKHPLLLFMFYLSVTSTKFTKTLFISLSALVLGSYWAFLEFNWGGFWSFDIVESTLLISACIYCFFKHLTFYIKTTISSTFFYIFSFSIVFFFLKFNNVPSIHNFVPNTILYYYWVFLLGSLLFSSVRVRFFSYSLLLLFIYSNLLKFFFVCLIVVSYITQKYFKLNKQHLFLLNIIVFCFFIISFNQIWLINFEVFEILGFYINNSFYIIANDFIQHFSLFKTNIKNVIKPSTILSINNYLFNYNITYIY